MKKLIALILTIAPFGTLAHECDRFADSDWAADEAYACQTSTAELKNLKLHRLEVCIGSVPYLDGKRYAHAEIKSVPLSQYNNPWNRKDGIHEKFFDTLYSGLVFAGEDFYEDANSLTFAALREGSIITHDWDILTGVKLNKKTGKAQFKVTEREPALLFKNAWQTRWDLPLTCQRIR